MAKGDDKNVRQEINTEQAAVNDRYQSLYGDLKQKSDTINTRSNEERQFLTDQFRSSSDTGGGLDPTVVNNIRGLYGWKDGSTPSSTGSGSGGSSSGSGGSGGGSTVAPVDPYAKPQEKWNNLADTGGMDMEGIRGLRGGLTTLGQTGGWDDRSINSVNDDITKLKGIAGDGGFDAARRTSIQGGIDRMKTYGDTGGYDPDSLGKVRGDIDSLRSWAGTGGYDPEALATSRNRIGTLDEYARTGGMSDEDIAKFRGTGFAEFAETGGWTPEQAAEYRNRSTSVIPAMYAQQMADANRLRNVSGSNTGFLAGASRLARQNNQALSTATRDTETDLQGQIREGRRYGITGLRDTEKQLQDILVPAKNQSAAAAALYGNQLEGDVAKNRTGILKDSASLGSELETNVAKNRITASGDATRLETDFQNSINTAMINASKGAGDLMTNMQTAIAQSKQKAEETILANETEAQKLRQQGLLAGAQGLTQLAQIKQAEAARAQANADSARSSDQANDRWWANFVASNERYIGDAQQSGRMDSLRGLTNLYGMDPTLGRDNLNVNASSAWADDNRGLLGLDVQANQSKGNNILDWLKFGSGFIPSGSKKDQEPNEGVSGNQTGDSSWNYGGDMGFKFPEPKPEPEPSTGGRIISPPNDDYDNYVWDGEGWVPRYGPGGGGK